MENTDDIDERRELRKQIRELRNKKFDEEMKKISSGEISASTVTNGLSTRKTARKMDENNEENADPYGLLEFNDEESLQELVRTSFLFNNNKVISHFDWFYITL